MKNNKGFTLIELLAVIIILAAVALVAFPILLNTIKSSEDKIDETTEKIVYNAAKLYVDENLNDYPPTNGNTYCIPFNDLIKSSYLEKGIIESAKVNPSEKTVKVTVSDEYTYEIVNTNECEAIVNNNGDENIDYCFLSAEKGDGTVTINRYNCNFTDITIPSTINGKKVSEIGNSAFWQENLTSVIIPDGVIRIGRDAFYGNQLTNITIPDSVTTIGSGAFVNNKLKKIIIPDSVTSIADGAFTNNQLENDVFIYNRKSDGSIDYTSLNSYAGANRTSVVIPDQVNGIKLYRIGGYAFKDCGIKEVTIPESVTWIGTYSFSGNDLTNIIIPKSTMSLGAGAFAYNSATGNDAFIYDRKSDGSIDYSSLNSYAGSGQTNVVIPGEVNGITLKKIGMSAFERTQTKGEIIIPDGVIEIGQLAFKSNQITNVTIPDSVTTIGSGAFVSNKLTSVTIKGKTSTADFATFEGAVFGWASGYSDSNIIWNG